MSQIKRMLEGKLYSCLVKDEMISDKKKAKPRNKASQNLI